MGTVHDKSDDEYSYVGDKGDIGFIDFDNCQSVCSYNPADESEIVNISVPFPLIEGRKPQSGIVGETMFDSVTIRNTTDESLDLWSVKIFDSKPEDSFKISLMKPPTADSDMEYIQDYMELVALDDRVIRPNQALTIWLSCKPKEIGVHSAAIHFSVGDEVIERLLFLLAEDSISKSLSSTRQYQRPQRKNRNIANQHAPDAAYVAARRPAGAGGRGRGRGRGPGRVFRYHLPEYPIPAEIRAMLSRHEIPDPVVEGLTVKNYGAFFKNLLAMEEIKLEEDMQSYYMEDVTMKSKRGQMLSLEVPGLAEKRPSLVSGDFIFAELASDGETSSPRYQGYIHRVEAEEILLKFDIQFHRSHRDGNLYNVEFNYNRTNMRRLYQAIEVAAQSLERNFLFPSTMSKVRLGKYKELTPICSDLNEEQKMAVNMIFVHKGGPPYVIHGPPGTGKTKTLIEAILQIYREDRNARILACAPSNSAADHILDRLINEEAVQIPEHEIFRLNAYTRPFDDVNPSHINFCHHEDCIFVCPPCKVLEQYRIIVSTYASASILYSAGIQRGQFSYIFLDEAGQASEPEAMVPISHLYSRNTALVLAGDPMQLGPVVFSREAEENGLGTSYLERLFECELYRRGDTKFMTKLVRNYRTHEAILKLPSEMFYAGELIPCGDKNSSTSWEGIIPDKEFPLLFIGIQGCDEREGNNPSWFNRIEASKTVEMIKVLIEEKGLKEEEIGVIAPYRKQVSKIKEALECLGNTNVKVGSVEQFQGQERKVIIVSTVRSTVKHNEFDKVHYLGFLSNPRRFNVAVTRAKSLIIIIGNPHIICKDPNWNKLLWYCVENNSYKGCFLPKQEEESEQVEEAYQSNWGENYQPSEEAYKYDQPSGSQWDENYQPSGSNWDEHGGGWQQDQWGDDGGWNQPSEVPCGEEENINLRPSEVPCGEEENINLQSSDAPQADGTNLQPSDAPQTDITNIKPLDVPFKDFHINNDVPWE
ncbi:probable RNA helicase SDE3 isoform X1 [Salvia hispanica]|uniref:probable RNA helicase SDE3 isoform X1 n=1 Tax=Salvia hispanica TaxID=49212 RepID=UPI00200951CF|nr:probable RNA helicase SDE3 isoform X1 [Salvia hispanica]XP_047983534.1 probable RNA helicase SDE3 isoform X1 [Salvia hispanica]